MSREGTQDAIESMGAWRPRSLRAPGPAWPSPRARSAVFAAVVLAHLGLALWLPWLDVDEAPAEEEAIQVGFIPPDPLPALPVEPADGPAREPERQRDAPADRPTSSRPPRRRPVTPQPLQVQAIAAPRKLELYGEDGRLKLPKDMLEQIDRKFGDTRTFSYQVPGMERADKLLNRPPPIAYESTRFDEYWQPDQDLLTSLLTQMVEKTTKEIRVKVPGRSQSTMVCKVSLLALGGGCGVLTPGSDYVGPVDDPDTLSPEEDRQCQAWWDQIVGATTQDAWRQTRKLYEAQCRKPLERAPAG
jgi:hypothetical protein